MVVQYKGAKDGISTTLTLKIYGGNLSKSSSNYEVDLFIGEKGANQVPYFTTAIHQSLSNCLKEIYLFTKHNHIVFEAASETTIGNLVPYDQVLYDFNKAALFLV